MARQRMYSSNAHRQQQYRERLKTQHVAVTNIPAVARKRSRPQRLRKTLEELEQLIGEYQQWVNALPENLSQGDLAEQLQETIEQLEEAVSLLGAISLPRGFGR